MKQFDSKYCDEFFKTYPVKGPLDAQLFWLKTTVLDDMDVLLYPCILAKHRIHGSDVYQAIVDAYWNGRQPVFTDIKIQKIKDLYFNKVINYKNFIAFSTDDDKNIIPYLVSDFSLNPPCFSLPFFEALNKIHKEPMLSCTLGRVPISDTEFLDTIVFAIPEAGEFGFYDFSQIPPFLPIKAIYL